MKARVKATGKMLPETTIVSFYDDGSMDDFFLNELELIPDDNSPDYWTRLEHTYAGMAMQSLIMTSTHNFGTSEQIAMWANEYATALVKELKEEK